MGVATQKPREETFHGEGNNTLFKMPLGVKGRHYRIDLGVSYWDSNKIRFGEVISMEMWFDRVQKKI